MAERSEGLQEGRETNPIFTTNILRTSDLDLANLDGMPA